MEAGFRQRLLTGTMLAGGALFGVGGAPTLAEAASCTTIIDNTGSMGQMAGTITADCTSLITLSPKGSLNISDPGGKANYDGTDDTLVGFINQSTTLITALHLTGGSPGSGIFDFDGDGGCQTARFTWVDPGACPVTTGSDNYADSAHANTNGVFAGVTFENISADLTSGDVARTGRNGRMDFRRYDLGRYDQSIRRSGASIARARWHCSCWSGDGPSSPQGVLGTLAQSPKPPVPRTRYPVAAFV